MTTEQTPQSTPPTQAELAAGQKAALKQAAAAAADDGLENEDVAGAEGEGGDAKPTPPAPKPAVAKDGEGEEPSLLFVSEKNGEEIAWEKETYGDLVASIFQKAGISMRAVADAWAKSGEVDSKVFDAVAQHGLPRSVFENYLDGLNASANANQREVQAIVDGMGGQSGMARIKQWAATSLSDKEKSDYQAVLASGDLAAIRLATSGIKARFEAENGAPPTTSIDTATVTGGQDNINPDVFQSRADIVEAMRDDRYKAGDRQYVAAVQAKVARSNLFGHMRR